jgi:hypothetical protein
MSITNDLLYDVVERLDPKRLIVSNQTEFDPSGDARVVGINWARETKCAGVFLAIPFHLSVDLSLKRPSSVQVAVLRENIYVEAPADAMCDEMTFVTIGPQEFLGAS